jgi:hypothetical protein
MAAAAAAAEGGEGGGGKGEGGRELEVGGCVLWMCDVAFFLGAYIRLLK